MTARPSRRGRARPGNRTDSRANGTLGQQLRFDAVNQVQGWDDDPAGTLRNDRATASTYDALSRLTSATRGSAVTTASSTGDGLLVAATSGSVTTRSMHDMAAPLRQVLGDGPTAYVYGLERLRVQGGPWYLPDALGSVRVTVSDAGVVLGSTRFDPWGHAPGQSPRPLRLHRRTPGRRAGLAARPVVQYGGRDVSHERSV